MNFIEELKWRGLFKDCTDEISLSNLVDSKEISMYAGFDPTSDSLTVGNLVPMMILAIAERHGHIPFVVMGGATARLGDPSGKSSERTMMTSREIDTNIESMSQIFSNILDLDTKILNNADWTDDVSFLDMLQDIGKHFSVNQMIQKDSVRNRLETKDQGISFTEFAYSIIQARDFLHLNDEIDEVVLQIGGSDQWGNIVSGVDLIHKIKGRETNAFGLTCPLMTKSDGGKFGKTEDGTIWLNKDKTSVFDFFQFWLNASDEDAEKWIKTFCIDLKLSRVEELIHEHRESPHKRMLQNVLAEQLTVLVHGLSGMKKARQTSLVLFGNKSPLMMDVDGWGRLADALEGVSWGNPGNSSMVDVLVSSGICKSKRISREHLSNGSVSVNCKKCDIDTVITDSDIMFDRWTLIKIGKKNWNMLDFLI